jgi:hypothetical protein
LQSQRRTSARWLPTVSHGVTGGDSRPANPTGRNYLGRYVPVLTGELSLGSQGIGCTLELLPGAMLSEAGRYHTYHAGSLTIFVFALMILQSLCRCVPRYFTAERFHSRRSIPPRPTRREGVAESCLSDSEDRPAFVRFSFSLPFCRDAVDVSVPIFDSCTAPMSGLHISCEHIYFGATCKNTFCLYLCLHVSHLLTCSYSPALPPTSREEHSSMSRNTKRLGI